MAACERVRPERTVSGSEHTVIACDEEGTKLFHNKPVIDFDSFARFDGREDAFQAIPFLRGPSWQVWCRTRRWRRPCCWRGEEWRARRHFVPQLGLNPVCDSTIIIVNVVVEVRRRRWTAAPLAVRRGLLLRSKKRH